MSPRVVHTIGLHRSGRLEDFRLSHQFDGRSPSIPKIVKESPVPEHRRRSKTPHSQMIPQIPLLFCARAASCTNDSRVRSKIFSWAAGEDILFFGPQRGASNGYSLGEDGDSSNLTRIHRPQKSRLQNDGSLLVHGGGSVRARTRYTGWLGLGTSPHGSQYGSPKRTSKGDKIACAAFVPEPVPGHMYIKSII
ncbi:hypothetical protein CC78DRAFT_617124 [Lojkania enalia]|uniref:Uncharacterized protein n=1 Tax=Lojkania enalia TaxID=147567 RepID=A0A9P4KCQ9_9PLEO|nr:hypothetical protein CC78DRAFT_617124 [Didymosphaeria enalia]